MTLHDCMERTPYRWYLTWTAWLESQKGVPSRSDYYLMQIAQQVYDHKKTKLNALDKFIIKFMRKKPEAPMSPEDQLARSKAIWLGWLGIKQKK